MLLSIKHTDLEDLVGKILKTLLELISPISFDVSNMATRKFSVLYVAHITFPQDRAAVARNMEFRLSPPVWGSLL